jgi:phosphohistidine phosphatase SixA
VSLNNRRLLLLVAVAAVALPVRAAGAETSLWQQLKSGGHILLIRHATTDPGIGDPPGFDLRNCATQRNLSAAGREEARRLGHALKQLEIPIAAVRSSRWCRCLETAQLAFGGAQPWPALDNTFDTPERRPQQMQEVRKLLMQPVSGGNLALITHGVNILALTGISPAENEIVAIRAGRDGKFNVVGRGIPYR